MLRKIIAALALTLGFAVSAHAGIVGAGSFLNATVIDFEDAPNGLIGGFYSSLGLATAHLSGGQVYSTGAGPASRTATNFPNEPGYPNGALLFSSLVTRVGMDFTTNDADDTTIYAYLGNLLVGSETFNTFGSGGNGAFIGVEFLSGFDRIVIDTFGPINGAFAMDNLRFEAVPEPATLALLGLPLLLTVVARRRAAR